MKKKIIITVCMAMTVLTGLAQSPLSFHAKAGIGTSHFHGKHSSSDTQIAYKAGVGAEYVLNKTWVLQSALEFVSIGGKDEISHIGITSWMFRTKRSRWKRSVHWAVLPFPYSWVWL